MGDGPPSEEDRHPQAGDLHIWCAVRELNPQPADSDYSPVTTCRLPWKPLRCNEIRDLSPPDGCRQLSLPVAKRCGEKCVCGDHPHARNGGRPVALGCSYAVRFVVSAAGEAHEELSLAGFVSCTSTLSNRRRFGCRDSLSWRCKDVRSSGLCA